MSSSSRLSGFVGALSAAGWHIPGDPDPIRSSAWPASTAAEILETADRLDMRQVWIYPDAQPGGAAWPAGAELAGLTLRTRVRAGHGPTWVWATRRSSPGRAPRSIEISLLEPADPDNPWSGLPPAVLLGELEAFEAALGARWSASGANTSNRWLRRHYQAPGGLRLAASDVVDVAVAAGGPSEMQHWSRPAGPAEVESKWVHAFDVNAMFLAAASSLALPVGPAEYFERPAADRRRVGWWRLAGDETWITTPTLELISQRAGAEGVGVDVEEAWIWGESHRWLEPWYRAIRHARGSLEPGRPAAKALKEVYTHGVSHLGSMARAAGERDALYQPYWSHAVRAEANARLARKLHRVRANHGAIPLALDVDCTWWAADEPDPLVFAAHIGLEVDAQLGHFKHAGTGRFDPTLLAGTSLEAIRALKKACR